MRNLDKKFSAWLTCIVAATVYRHYFPDPPAADFHATGLELVFLGAVIMAVVAGLLLKKPKNQTSADDRPPTTSQRGEQISYILGRRIAAPKVMWVGRRVTRERSTGGGGSGPFGGGGAKQIEYLEDAVHVVALGPGSFIYQILLEQKAIFTGPISPDTTPSGSVLQDIDGNSFAVYWGHHNQPINTSLGENDALGVASRWPYHFYIHWLQRNLGTSAVWSQIDYDAECRCVGTDLPDSDCTIPDSVTGAEDGGQNGAHIMYQLLTGAHPHGAGIPPEWIDFGSLKALGILLQNERMAQNVLIQSDAGLEDALSDILADATTFIVEEKGKLAWVPLRSTQVAQPVNEDIIVSPLPTFSINHGQQQPNDILFLYPDVKHLFRDTDIPIPDDAAARVKNAKQGLELRINTVTNETTAARTADRRKQLFIADGTKTNFSVGKTGRRLVVGSLVTIPEIGEVRITGTKKDAQAGKAEIEAAINSYSLLDSDWVPENPLPDPAQGPAGPDDQVVVFEAPRRYAGRQMALAIIRGRDNGSASPARVYVSLTGTTYTLLGNQDSSAASGILLDDLAASPKRRILESGPRVALSSAAARKILDLTSDEDAWRAGRQICVIDGEIMFLQSITALGGGIYRLNGLIRGRLETEIENHAAISSPRVFIEPADFVSLQSDTAWSIGATLRVKCVPSGVSIDAVTPVLVHLTGKALGPLPISNLSPLSFTGAPDIVFTWSHRLNLGTGAGAGELTAGMPTGTPPGHEGTFRVEAISLSGNVKRTVEVSSETWTYTAADRVTDIASAGYSFYIRITNIIGAVGGYSRTFLIEGS